jgi:hypothetical protein
MTVRLYVMTRRLHCVSSQADQVLQRLRRSLRALGEVHESQCSSVLKTRRNVRLVGIVRM